MNNTLFRWAIGDNNPMSNTQYSNAGFGTFLRMAKTSILSFQVNYPVEKYDTRYVVAYNGPEYNYFKESFNRSSPSLPCEVELINARSEFSFPFKGLREQPSVWWKWVPFRFDVTRTEIFVDTDVICLRRPTCIEEQLVHDLPMTLVSDFLPYFSEDTCGTLEKNECLKGRIPLNCGFAAFKPGVSIEAPFLAAVNTLEGHSHHRYFLDEQGCFNVAIYQDDRPFALLPRDVFVYGIELAHRLRRGMNVQVCHFTANSKALFQALEPKIFRKIYDKNYTQDDWLGDIENVHIIPMPSSHSPYPPEPHRRGLDLEYEPI